MNTPSPPGEQIRRLRIAKLELEIERLRQELSSSSPIPDPEQPLRVSKLELEIRQLNEQLSSSSAGPTPDSDEPLRHSKLELEVKQLTDQTSIPSKVLEWIKAAATPIAVFALIWTVIVGYRQMKDNRETRDEERFDKAVSRLGSANSSERLTGVAGLGLFLTERQRDHHVATLIFITGAIAAEKDPIVRGSLLELIAQLDPNVVSEEARDQGLRSVIDKNRRLVQSASSPDRSMPTDWKQTDELPFHQLSEDDKALLGATGSAIALFVQKGTHIKDFSGIYCAGCNFSSSGGALDLAGSNFDRALLRDANFSRTNLKSASFDSADLIGSKFIKSNLELAHLTDSSEAADESYLIRYFVATGKAATSPDLECADLGQADFAGSMFFGLVEGSDDQDLRATYADLRKANLAGTNFGKIRIFSLHRHDIDGTGSSVQSNSIPLTAAKMILKRSVPQQSVYKLAVVGVDPWKIREPLGIRFKNSLKVLMENFESSQHLDQASLPAALNGLRGRYSPPATNRNPCHM